MIFIGNLSNESKIDEILKYLNRDLSQIELNVLNYLIDNIYYITEEPTFSHEDRTRTVYTHFAYVINYDNYNDCYYVFYNISDSMICGCFIEGKSKIIRDLREEKINKIINENDK